MAWRVWFLAGMIVLAPGCLFEDACESSEPCEDELALVIVAEKPVDIARVIFSFDGREIVCWADDGDGDGISVECTDYDGFGDVERDRSGNVTRFEATIFAAPESVAIALEDFYGYQLWHYTKTPEYDEVKGCEGPCVAADLEIHTH